MTQHSKMQHIRRKKQRAEKLLSNEIKREKKIVNAKAKPAAKTAKAKKPAKTAKAAKAS